MDPIEILFLSGLLLLTLLILVGKFGGKSSRQVKSERIMKVLEKDTPEDSVVQKDFNPIHFSEVQSKGHMETSRKMERGIYRK